MASKEDGAPVVTICHDCLLFPCHVLYPILTWLGKRPVETFHAFPSSDSQLSSQVMAAKQKRSKEVKKADPLRARSARAKRWGNGSWVLGTGGFLGDGTRGCGKWM